LKYVLDHDLVPRLKWDIVKDEVGRPRKFAEDVGFAIVCAATLLKLGLSHRAIGRFIAGLLEFRFAAAEPHPGLAFVLRRNSPAWADFGDGEFVRIRLKPGDDPEWIRPGKTGRKAYSAAATLTLDIGRIRDDVYSV
jgi:hypothetical protein